MCFNLFISAKKWLTLPTIASPTYGGVEALAVNHLIDAPRAGAYRRVV